MVLFIIVQIFGALVLCVYLQKISIFKYFFVFYIILFWVGIFHFTRFIWLIIFLSLTILKSGAKRKAVCIFWLINNEIWHSNEIINFSIDFITTKPLINEYEYLKLTNFHVNTYFADKVFFCKQQCLLKLILSFTYIYWNEKPCFQDKIVHKFQTKLSFSSKIHILLEWWNILAL